MTRSIFPPTIRTVATLATTATLASAAWALQPARGDSPSTASPGASATEAAPPIEWSGAEWRRVEARANEFTSSTQDAACLARTADGGSVLAWQSRRQQGGGYGVYARRFDANGRPLGDEVQLNTSVAGMQMRPVVATDGQGGLWFAWFSSRGDSDRGAIVVRRFDPTLEAATDEFLVCDEGPGHQDEPVVYGLADGGAVVALTSDAGDGGRELLSRRFGADGSPSGPLQVLEHARGERITTPTVEPLPEGDGAWLAFARFQTSGQPSGAFVLRVDEHGRAVAPAIPVSARADQHAIEPELALDAHGDPIVGYFEPEPDGYALRVRFPRRDEAGTLGFGEVVAVDAGGAGYVSGLDLAARTDGSALCAYSRFGDGERARAGLFLRVVRPDGTLGEPLRATSAVDGDQRLAVACGGARLLADERELRLAWSGEAELGDSSGVHLTRLCDAALAPLAAPLATTWPGLPALDADGAATGSADATESSDGLAAPHDPPTFDARDAVSRPNEPITHGPGGDFDFLGITSTGWTPPDPSMAAGPNHVVTMTNGAIAWFANDGTFQFQDEIEDNFGFWGAQGATGFVFDPEVIFDPHSQRFMAMACERGSNNRPYYLLAISDDADPNGTWHKYRIDVLTDAGDTDIDSPNISVDEDVIYLTSDFFGPDKFLVYMIDKASVLNGGAIVANSTVVNGSQSMGMPVTHDTGVPAHYMVEAFLGGGAQLRLWAIENPLTGPTISTTLLSVPTYTPPEDPPQLGTSVRPNTFECRFWSAVYRDGMLYATHHIGLTRVVQRWYQIDMNGWPSGGTPTLVQSGTVDLGGTLRTFFGSIGVDAAGNVAMTYARSSPTERISMERTWRAPTDPAGTMRPGVNVIASTAADNSGRWGDYSATIDDPSGTGFWGTHEYREASGWRTRIAFWNTCPETSLYCSSSPNSVGTGARIDNAGSTSIAANDLELIATQCPPTQPGLFYFGTTQIQVPFGNGFRCAGGTTVRLPIISIDVLGEAHYSVNLGGLPGGATISAGDTRYFQFWYRDPAGGGAAFNLSDGLEATFCP